MLIDFSRNMMWQHKTDDSDDTRNFFQGHSSHFLKKQHSYRNVIQGHCMALRCRRVSNREFAGIIKGIGTAQSLSLAFSAIQPEKSVNAGKTGSGFCQISPSLLEAAMGSHIKRSILTVHIEVLPCIMPDYALQHKVISISSS